MKLSTKLFLIVCGAVLGLVLVGGFAVVSLRSTMLEERQQSMRLLVTLAVKQVEHFQSVEKSGKLSREDAQTAAKEALRALHNGDDYIFVRTGEKLLLSIVHPDPRKEGTEGNGGTLPNGQVLTDAYLAALQISNPAIVHVWTKRPSGNVEVPKISVIQRVPDWNWVVGSGVFVDDVESAFWRYVMKFMLIGGVVFAGVVALAFWLARGIYRSIGGEPAYAAAVAQSIAAGDLSHAIVVSKGDSVSLLAGMSVMQENLRQMIGGIQRGATTLNGAAESLTGQMTQINSAAQQSADATGSTAAAIEQMAVSVGHISDNAKESELKSQRSATLAATGESHARQVAEELNQVALQVGDASARIEGLVERTREIGGIANVIKEIADQTNLLALNAAIEAARAGEQGRGFAVVADEVRKLADRTSQATGQITGMIQAIQDDTTAVVGSMHAVTPQVTRGVETANNAANTLREINAEANATLANFREVANSTSEQSTASDSVAGSVEKIAQMIEAMASSVNSANQNVQTLERLAVELRDSVARFRV
jgi:methyl-accepting chemotaxis protein/methyl-accepting chemotaxis protein-3 (ribose and galactose sensor receptor)